MGNKKQERLAKRAQEAAEQQLHAGDVEQESTVQTETGDAAQSTGLVESTTDSEVIGSEDVATTTEGVAKPDVNAESKAKAEANRKAKAEKTEKELRQKYPHVVSIAARGPNGPTRVVIECTDPQTKQVDGKAVPVCEKTREIAVQDLFQVTRCAACQDRITRKSRRVRQAAKDKELRKLAQALKQG